MRTGKSAKATGLMLVATLVAVVGLAGCGSSEPTTGEPTTFVTPPAEGTIAGPGGAVAVTGPIAVVGVDSSGSVVGTDLLVAAENRVRQLIDKMPVGGKVVVSSINNNVGAMCDPLTFSLPPQANRDLERQAREAAVQVAGRRFRDYIACSTGQDPGGTELFGGLSEMFSYYPTAQIIDVYTDGCDTVTTPGICKVKNLRNPTYPGQVLSHLPPSVTPHLSPAVQITFHGIGRNTRLPADAIATLRQLISGWAQLTTATTYFTAS